MNDALTWILDVVQNVDPALRTLLAGVGMFLETSVKRADATAVPSRVVFHEVRCTRLPVVVRSNSHRSLGMAHSSRPPSRESAESTQMSVMLTLRPPAAFTGRLHQRIARSFTVAAMSDGVLKAYETALAARARRNG